MSMRLPVLVAVALALWVGSACSGSTSQANPSPTSSTGTASPSPASSPAGKLGAEVPMPAGFPADYPIYPGGRLTAAAKVASNGSTNWTMEWHTLDGPDKVQSFYVGKLDAGDWNLITYSGTVGASFSATFTRKSNQKVAGALEVTIIGGVTKIALVLTTFP